MWHTAVREREQRRKERVLGLRAGQPAGGGHQQLGGHDLVRVRVGVRVRVRVGVTVRVRVRVRGRV